jgi:hypothetical protein
MTGSLERQKLVQHWPLLVPVAAWLLLFGGAIQSEIVRAVIAVGCFALMIYQWILYRRTHRGSRLLFVSLIVAGFMLASIWLALNVVRFYSYGHPSDNLGLLYSCVVRVQDSLIWPIGVLVTIVCVWSTVGFGRWLVARRPFQGA